MARQTQAVTVVGVASRDTEAAMAEFVARHDLGHVDHVADEAGEVWEHNGISGQPAWIFVDDETGEATTQFGALDAEGLTAALRQLDG